MPNEQQSSRLLTLVFTDVVDSTALKSQHGDFRAGELLQRDRDHVQRLAAEHNGRVIDWAGDGCFLTYETSSEAVLFAIDLQRAHLGDHELPPIRIGLHIGEVTERSHADGTVRVEGLTVDLTARLESLAHPNQILMSEAVYHSARQRLRHREPELTLLWKSHGAFHLKGFDEPIEVCVAGIGDASPMEEPTRSEKAWPAGSEQTSSAGPHRRKDDLRLLRRLIRRPQGIAALVGLVAAIALGMFYLPTLEDNKTEAKVKWARKEAVPAVRELLESKDYAAAYALAVEADEYIDDMLLDQLIGDSSDELSFTTNEAGARVSYKLYEKPESDWKEAGITPIASIRIPVGIYRWNVELDGFATREFVRPVYPGNEDRIEGIGASAFDLTLVPDAPETEGMTFVEGGAFYPSITGIGMLQYDIDDFFVDVTEVTNAAYREFVEAGGYTDSSYWTETFLKNGEVLPFDQAKERFLDTTGRTGPSVWVLGDVPPGQEDYPVQGLSWFEAMAYAKFRGRMLPTVYHWARAALPAIEAGNLVLTPLMMAYSNMESDGPIPVASTPDMSSAGAYNMAGNVREWCLNERGGLRFAMGGQWDQPEYALFNAIPIDPWDRSEGNGFRCMRIPEGAEIQSQFIKPLGEFVFEAKRNKYTPEALRAIMGSFLVLPQADYGVSIDSVNTDHRHYIREELTIDGPGAAADRLPLIIQRPKSETSKSETSKSGEGPWPAVIFSSGLDALLVDDPDSGLVPSSQFIPQSNRMLVRPILSGTYYRNDGDSVAEYLDPRTRPAVIQTWIQELNQTVAYLKTRPDVDPEAISFYGISLGAVMGIIFAGSNDDIQTVVLALGGLPPLNNGDIAGPAPLVEEFATLVNQPVLMLNGRYDFLFPVEQSQKSLLDLLAADPSHKRHKLYDEGHSMPAQSKLISEIVTWLDKYERGIPETQAKAAAVE